jgi:maleate isomerase
MADLDETLALLSGAKPDVVLYGCTSATLSHGPGLRPRPRRRDQGPQRGGDRHRGGRAGPRAAHSWRDPIAFASPYVPAINDMAIAFLAEMGIETVARADLDGTLSNEGQGALTPRMSPHLRCGPITPTRRPLVLSCTDMRAVECVADVEARLGKPVVTSNQAMLFQALQILNIAEPIPGFGQLLERAPPMTFDNIARFASARSISPTPRSTPPRRC